MASWTEKIAYILSVDDSKFDFQGSLAQLSLVNDTVQEMVAGINETYENMINLASSFEAEMANVSTLLDTDAAGMDRYKNAILQLSTEVPSSANELASGLYQVISAGVDASKSMEVLEVASKSAVAGMSDSFTAVDAITTILNAYNMDASEATNISDILFQTVKMGKTTFGELSAYVGTFATNAATLGIDLKDVNAAMATMTKSGLNTARSATALDAIMREITKKGEVVSLFKQAGYESAEAALQANGLQGSIKLLGEQASKSGKRFSDLWGEEALRGAQIINTNFELAKSDLESYSSLVGTTAEAYEKANDTLANAEQQRQNAQDAMLIKMGQDLLPMHKAYNEVLTKMYNTLGSMPPNIRGFASAFMVAGKGLGSVAGTTSTLMRDVAGIREGFQALKPSIEKLKEMKDALKNVEGGSRVAAFEASGLGKALSSAGLAMAIAFTVTQLNGLKDAIFEYASASREAEQRTQETLDNLSKQAVDRTKESNASIYRSQLDRVAKYEEINKKLAKLNADRDGAEIQRLYLERENILTVQDYQREKEELIAANLITEKTATEEISELARLGFEEQKKYSEKGVEVNKKVEEATVLSQQGIGSEYEKTTDKIKRLYGVLTGLGGNFYLPEGWEKLDDKKLLTMVEQITKQIATRKLQIEKEYEDRLNKYREDNAKNRAQMDLETLKRETLEKTDYEISQLSKDYNKKIELAGDSTDERLKIEEEYKIALAGLYEEQNENIKNYYAKIQENIETAKQQEIESANGKIELINEIEEKYRIITLENENKKNEELLKSDREYTDKQESLIKERIEVEKDGLNELQQAQLTLWQSLGSAMENALTTPKETLKNSLIMMLDYLKRMMQIKYAEILAKDIASKGFFGVGSAAAKYGLIEAAFGLAKNAVAKFETSGIPQHTGLAVVEPKDVIINPSQKNNPVIDALANRLQEKQVDNRPQNIILQVDKRILGSVTIEDIRSQNMLLPKNRSVFDESIRGTS